MFGKFCSESDPIEVVHIFLDLQSFGLVDHIESNSFFLGELEQLADGFRAMDWNGIIEVGIVTLDQSSFGLVFLCGRLMSHADEVVLGQFWLNIGPCDFLVVVYTIDADALPKLPPFYLPQDFQIFL
jgi:hypothetical protein